MKCRHCHAEATLPFVDLGSAPHSNAYLAAEMLHEPEKWYPLRVVVCTECWLVQMEDFADRSELFSADYAYFSSFSATWLAHARKYVAEMIDRFDLDDHSQVVEVASNDGYLLQYFNARRVPCLGVEPTRKTAEAARARGVETVEAFFGVDLANRLVGERRSADLVVANNVLAHVPDINDFVAGVARLLKPHGVATFEFPHLLRLVLESQFDTIYHEHYSYLSLEATRRIFTSNGLSLFDVEELTTHGGSLRVYAQRSDLGRRVVSDRVAEVYADEAGAGVRTPGFYADFQAKADCIKDDFVGFLIDAKRAGERVAAYGAAAKGNTLMNYAGIRRDLVRYVVDRNPAKQGKFTPGSRVRIVDEDHLRRDRPDVVVILPWNLKAEIAEQLGYVKAWGGRLVTPMAPLEAV